ncbi:MAG: ATP-binding cassette domain-containing protein [Oscillospiraceae bacterium]|jgi:sodium transport system ATP-binding protein|nr:ATP-binding cassette domain-containing protein [Oscillospiraceae bacterium]
MLELKALTKRFPVTGKHRKQTGQTSLTAVDGLSLQVSGGRIYGLLGANGAGKTTTLRMVATMLTPSEGTATVDGCDIITRADEVRRKTGLLFGGDVGLYDRLTAYENIQYFARLNDVPDEVSSARIHELAEQFRFTEHLQKAAGKLSKGTRQKVSFARAIIHDPQLMLFDEPTLGLDVTAKKEAEDFILHCRDKGKTIVLSDHTLSVVERLCDRIGILGKGKLLGEGTIDELTRQHECKSLEEVFFKLAEENAAL